MISNINYQMPEPRFCKKCQAVLSVRNPTINFCWYCIIKDLKPNYIQDDRTDCESLDLLSYSDEEDEPTDIETYTR
jgi:hypothetical protein